MPKKFREFVACKWKDYALIAVLFGYVASLLLVNLRNMVPLLKIEDPAQAMILSGQDFIDNILFLPIRAIQYGLIRFDLPYIDLRFVSAGFGLLACVILYQLLHKWHTRRVSFGIVVLFASSSLFLASSRLATTDVIYLLAIPMLLICGSWLRKKRDINKLPLSVLVTVSLLYLPGMWLFALGGVIALRRRISIAWRLNSVIGKMLTILVPIVFLSPLAYSFYSNPDQITTWLGLPDIDTITLSSLLHNFVNVFDVLFWSGLEDRSIWLTGTAVLDVFSIIALVLGVYYYLYGYHPLRKRVLIGFGLMSIFFLTIGGPVPITLLLPLVYIFVAGGVALMLQQWFTVFPRNPLAKGIALTLISVALIASCFYNTQRFFVAWPATPETTQAIQSKRL